MRAIIVEKLVKRYGGLCVLNELSFEVEFGELKGIIGPNGAGKTTLFNVISGETPPSSGEVVICGHNVTDLSVEERARLGLGRTFQSNNLFPNLTVLENTLLAVRRNEDNLFRMIRSVKKYKDSLAEAQKFLQAVLLWEKRDIIVKSLSHGEQRSLEIGLGLGSKPKIILMDEPTAGLSASEVGFLAKLIQEIKKDITILLIAHDIDFVLGLADSLVVINFGQLVAQGTSKEIAANKAVREIYIGREHGK